MGNSCVSSRIARGRPAEYDEFRRIALHLQWLSNHRHLFTRSLVFEETLVADYHGVPRAEDINNGSNLGLRWRQKSNGHYELTRLKVGRVVVTNVDPMALTDAQRFELNEKVQRNPADFVYVDIRPDAPGGEFAFQGALKLRSMFQILLFVAAGIHGEPEHDVTPDPRTGEIGLNPRSMLQINVNDSAPDKRSPFIRFQTEVVYSPRMRRFESVRFTTGMLLSMALELAFTACSLPGSRSAPTAGAPTSATGWVLVQVPKDIPADTYPPIEKTKRVNTFPTFAECDNFRTEVLWDAAAMASEAMDSEASALRCIADEAGSAKATGK
jgi:hypothetical protein